MIFNETPMQAQLNYSAVLAGLGAFTSHRILEHGLNRHENYL